MTARKKKTTKEPNYDFSECTVIELRDIVAQIQHLARYGIKVPATAADAALAELEARDVDVVCKVSNGRLVFAEILTGDVLATSSVPEGYYDAIVASRTNLDALPPGSHFIAAWYATLLATPDVAAPWMQGDDVVLEFRILEDGEDVFALDYECDCDCDCDCDEDDEFDYEGDPDDDIDE